MNKYKIKRCFHDYSFLKITTKQDFINAVQNNKEIYAITYREECLLLSEFNNNAYVKFKKTWYYLNGSFIRDVVKLEKILYNLK